MEEKIDTGTQDALNSLDLATAAKQIAEGESQEPEKKEKDDDLDLAQFKNPKEVLKGYKEIQGYATRVSQENKTLKEEKERLSQEMAELRERVELISTPQAYAPPPQMKQEDFETQLARNPENTIKQMLHNEITVSRIAEVLDEERDANPNEFRERYAFVQMLSNDYPNLSRTPTGVRKLFKKADEVRKNQLRSSAYKSLEYIFGEPLNDGQIQKLKEVVGLKGEPKTQTTDTGLGNAYMPDGGSPGRSRMETEQKPNRTEQIRKAVDEGNVDAVLDAVFKEALGG